MTRPPIMVMVLAGAFLLLVAALLMGSLRHVELPAYTPTPPAPLVVGDSLVGPGEYTIDATDNGEWQRFDFDVNSLVNTGLGWDVGFHRNHVIAGPGAAIVNLGPVPFDSVAEAPVDGYRANGPGKWDSNPAIGKWYDYSLISHLLTTRKHTYVVRTADGHYAKFEMLNYYCMGVGTACVTFRYAYQGDGTRRLR